MSFMTFQPVLFRGHGLLQVSNDVVHILNTNREADEIRRDPRLTQLLFRELPVGVAGGVEHASARVGHVGDNGYEVQIIISEAGGSRIVLRMPESNEVFSPDRMSEILGLEVDIIFKKVNAKGI